MRSEIIENQNIVITALTSAGEAVLAANPARSQANLSRRVLKLVEELGEVSEAYLGVTSGSSNGKGKTWDDFREETADVFIVGMDIALTFKERYKHYSNPMPQIMASSSVYSLPENFDKMFLSEHILICMQFVHLGMQYIHATMHNDRKELENFDSNHWHWMTSDTMKHIIRIVLFECDDQKDVSIQDRMDNFYITVIRKLEKWSNNRAKMEVVTDDV